MADEPNKRMDETLRAYADERRKAPGVPLHPATRKLLQDEVARIHAPARPRGGWMNHLRTFWPQLAFGGSLCVILGLAVLSLRQPTRSGKNAQSPPAVQSLSSEGETVAAPPLKLEEAGIATEQPVSLGLQVQATGSEIPVPAPSPELKETIAPTDAIRLSREDRAVSAQAPTVASKKDLAESNERRAEPAPAPTEGDVQLFQKQQANVAPLADSSARGGNAALEGASTPSAAAAPALRENYSFSDEKLLRAREFTNLGAARRLNFVQQSAPERSGAFFAKATATLPVLQSFQVEQLGRNMRVLDGDGSVYLGELEILTNAIFTPASRSAATGRLSADRSAPQPTAAAELQNSAVFNFTLRGTNQTLRSSVVLTGQYFEQTNPPAAPVPASRAGLQLPSTARQQGADARHLIIGNAVIGQTNQLQIRAVATEQ